MKHALLFKQDVRLLCATGGVVLAFATTTLAQAQLPSAGNALTRASMHTVAARAELAESPEAFEAPATPEAPQGNTPEIRDDLFNGTEKFAKGASDVTEVDMDPNSLNLVHGPDSSRAHRTVLSVVRTYSYDKPGMYNPADVEEYRRKLTSGDWHCSVHTRDMKSGESTDVCSKRRAPDMIENAIITVEPKSLTFIHNIRKVDGQGSSNSNDNGAFSGSMFLPESASALGTPGADAALNAQMRAQMLASAATLRAQLPVMLGQLHLSEDQLAAEAQHMQQQREAFQRQIGPQLREQMQHLQDQLKSNELNSPALP